MHSHTKLERSVATNDTTLTNDQRNKLDNNAMPVRAPPLTTCLAATLNFLCASACPHTYHATIKETLCTVLACGLRRHSPTPAHSRTPAPEHLC